MIDTVSMCRHTTSGEFVIMLHKYDADVMVHFASYIHTRHMEKHPFSYNKWCVDNKAVCKSEERC